MLKNQVINARDTFSTSTRPFTTRIWRAWPGMKAEVVRVLFSGVRLRGGRFAALATERGAEERMPMAAPSEALRVRCRKKMRQGRRAP